MREPEGLSAVLGRVSSRSNPDTEYSQRIARLESQLRVAVSDVERILRLAARDAGASGEDLEERVRSLAGAAVRMAAERAVEEHRSATRHVGRTAPDPAGGA